MKRHVGDFVRRCLTCQQVKAEHQKPAGLLQPLEVAGARHDGLCDPLATDAAEA